MSELQVGKVVPLSGQRSVVTDARSCTMDNGYPFPGVPYEENRVDPFEFLTQQYPILTVDEWYGSYRVRVKVKLVHPDARMPEYGHATDSCFDIFSVETVGIRPGEIKRVPIGIIIQAGLDWDFQFEDKSGLSAKGITVRGGTIDSGFTGELSVLLVNESDQDYVVDKGTKVTQVRIQKRYRAVFEAVNEIDSRDRGANGYGSTGLTGRPQ